MKKNSNLSTSKKETSSHQSKNSTFVRDDRLGPDEPLDEANTSKGEPLGVTAEEEAALTSDHRVSKIEPDDEHNNEDLVEEGMQGHMHGSLTKPRKTK
jgi:hypothetical protein